jgi:tetratricopeptide (TPR) repeat protein
MILKNKGLWTPHAAPTEAIRLDPKYAPAHISRGNVWTDQKEYDKAIADYNEGVRLDPKQAAFYVNRVFAWSGKKEYDQAIADCNQAIKLDPKFILAYNSRGKAWSDKKEFDKAIADYNQAIKLDPKCALAYDSRGRVWSNKREFAKAIADYDQAITLDPAYTAVYNSRAWLWATCPDGKYRDGKKAVQSATKACELSHWNEPNDLDTLAAAHAEAGDFVQAVKWQSQAIELLKDEKAKKDFRIRLELYQQKKPYRASIP